MFRAIETWARGPGISFLAGAFAVVAVLCGSCPAATASTDRGLTSFADPKVGHPKEKIGPVEAEQRGDAAWQTGDLEWAIYYYVLSMQSSPTKAVTLAKIGDIEAARGESALAQQAFEMAHAVDAQDARIGERLGQMYLQQRRIEEAAGLFGAVLTAEPRRTRALDGMGEVLLARGDYVQAVQYFDRALLADGADAAAILGHRGFAKLLLNDLAGASLDLHSAVERDPRSVAWRYLAELQVKQNDPSAAFASLSKLMDIAHAYNELGVLLMDGQNYRDAKDYFSKAVSASPVWYEESEKNLALANERLASSTH